MRLVNENGICIAPSYSAYRVFDNGKAIRFDPCGVTSHHPRDVEQHYCGRCHCVIEHAVMSGWTIYDHPSDYPHGYIARKWVVEKSNVVPLNEVYVAGTLDELRGKLPPGLTCLPRAPSDDKVIVEVWL